MRYARKVRFILQYVRTVAAVVGMCAGIYGVLVIGSTDIPNPVSLESRSGEIAMAIKLMLASGIVMLIANCLQLVLTQKMYTCRRQMYWKRNEVMLMGKKPDKFDGFIKNNKIKRTSHAKKRSFRSSSHANIMIP